jgi:Protein of unknown function (DUF1360)
MLNTTRSPASICVTADPTFSTIPHRLVTEDVALVHEGPEHLLLVQVRPADPGRGDPHDRVRQLLDRRIGHRRMTPSRVSYAALTVAFHGLVAVYALAHRRSERELPTRLPVGDFVPLAAATQELSRVISKDHVTSCQRRPFTPLTKARSAPRRFQRSHEASGIRLAIGELPHAPLLGLAHSTRRGHRYDPCSSWRPRHKRHQRP